MTTPVIASSFQQWLIMLPFAGVLCSLSLLPVLMSRLWHRFEVHILSFWVILSVALLVPHLTTLQLLHFMTETIWSEYFPFIALMFALYTISGGIHLSLQNKASPMVNTQFFIVAALCASVIGTTGASMLFIRPFLHLNQHRHYKTHLVVFFIIVVSNIAGSLTPLGDPPLFLGFLEGVPFLWPLLHLWGPFLFLMTTLLTMFYGVDSYLFKKETTQQLTHAHTNPHSDKVLNISRIQGKKNIPILFCVMGVVATLHHLPAHQIGNLFGVKIETQALLFIIAMVGFGLLSKAVTHPRIYEMQRFHFGPVLEVARVFAAIFITLIPVNMMLSLGADGPFQAILTHLSTPNSQRTYFWLTGIFSSMLDNAPTYLVFFKLAGGNVIELITDKSLYLTAISMGAVFMGAMTYIGNAPNFMVLSIAKQHHIAMPSFLMYILWVTLILVPLLVIVSFVWL